MMHKFSDFEFIGRESVYGRQLVAHLTSSSDIWVCDGHPSPSDVAISISNDRQDETALVDVGSRTHVIPIGFIGSAIRVGPLVTLGGSPCLSCATRDDPFALHGSLDSEGVPPVADVLIEGLLRRRFAGRTAWPDKAFVTYDLRTLAPGQVSVVASSSCGCASR